MVTVHFLMLYRVYVFLGTCHSVCRGNLPLAALRFCSYYLASLPEEEVAGSKLAEWNGSPVAIHYQKPEVGACMAEACSRSDIEDTC